MKLGGKLVIGALIVGVTGYFGNMMLDKGTEKGIFSAKTAVASAVPTSLDLPAANVASNSVSVVDLKPSAGTFVVPVSTIPWNGAIGLHAAVGGEVTQAGSIMEKHGVKVSVKRTDMYDQMIADMVAFAKQRKDGVANPTEGVAMHIIMGDAAPAHMRGLNAALSKYGQSAEIIAIAGFSRGEDKCMLPAAAKADPQKARGMAVGGVPRDGDLHICFKWAGDNGVPINPDGKTYNPAALNIMEVDDFNKSDQNLIAHYCEDRPVVNDAGKRTGSTAKVCQNGTATWTPGDVTVAKNVPGIVSVASTKEYANQMASTIIGNKEWMAANPEVVKNFLAAVLAGSESVLSSDAALDKAAATIAKVMKQENAAYWKKYYKGMTETLQDTEISLGGSMAAGLADNAKYFGLQGNDNIYKKVYTVFGNLDKTYYPSELPDFPAYETVVNTKYLEALLSSVKTMAPAQTATYSATAQVKSVVSAKAWNIEFETGKATFTPKTMAILDDLLNQMSIGNLTLQINGHTDNVGDPNTNLGLSNKRANAVKAYLIANAPTTMTADRIRARGYGDMQPIADNNTPAGKAKNRRVEVSQVSTQ